MKRIMLIDDDRHEALFWRHIIQSSYLHLITLEWFATVEQALAELDSFQPDAIVLDNKVPPHDTADYGLSELKKRAYEGDIYVWSFSDKEALQDYLKKWPEIETLSKQDYMGVKVRDLIETRLI